MQRTNNLANVKVYRFEARWELNTDTMRREHLTNVRPFSKESRASSTDAFNCTISCLIVEASAALALARISFMYNCGSPEHGMVGRLKVLDMEHNLPPQVFAGEFSR